MIEKEIVRLYKKLKSRTLASVKNDAVFQEFVRILTTGKRSYTLHNSELVKSIDETWVKAIEECIPHLESIIGNPRRYMKQMETVVPVELAKKTTAESVRHLASNAQNIDKIESGRVIPKKILSTYQEESYELYENRFVMTLLERVNQFIERRYHLLGEKGGNEFTSELSSKGGFRQNDEDTEYGFSMKIHQGAEYLGGLGVASEIFERIEVVRSYMVSFRRSKFMREMNGSNPVRPPVMKTNLLTKDPDYRACYKLWQFMDRYDKVGYSVEVSDVNSEPDEDFISDIDALLLFQYLVLKNKMTEFGDRKTAADYRRKRVVRPKFSKEYNKDVPDTYRLEDRSVLKVNLDGSNAREVNQKLRKAVGRALVLEAHKKNLVMRERNEENQRVLQALINALAKEKRKDRFELKRFDAEAKNMEKLLANVLTKPRADGESGAEETVKPKEKTAAFSTPQPNAEKNAGGGSQEAAATRVDAVSDTDVFQETDGTDGETGVGGDIADELSSFEELILHRGEFTAGGTDGEDEAGDEPDAAYGKALGETGAEEEDGEIDFFELADESLLLDELSKPAEPQVEAEAVEKAESFAPEPQKTESKKRPGFFRRLFGGRSKRN